MIEVPGDDGWELYKRLDQITIRTDALRQGLVPEPMKMTILGIEVSTHLDNYARTPG